MIMENIELNIEETLRLLDSIRWTLNPYLDEPGTLSEHPWLMELAESYNEVVSKIPHNWRIGHEQVLVY